MRWPLAVIGLWVVLAAGLSLTIPSLADMVEKRPVAILPADAPVNVATRQMTEAFDESGADGVLLVVLSNDKVGPADEGVYRKLVATLRQDRDVVMVQDFLSTPALREVLTSKDGRAWLLPINVAGELGSQAAHAAYTRVTDSIRKTVARSTLTVNLAGPAATVADLTDVGESDQRQIEIAVIVMVLAILLIIYRNPITMMLPLITIGVSLVTAQSIVAGLAQLGLGVSNQTMLFLSAILAGAGTDYAVFLISRYHDYVRLGSDSQDAVRRALTSVGKVIAASAATMVVTFLGMAFAQLGVFSTVGPALAVSISVVFLAAVTLLPAILCLAGPRGWIAPRQDLASRFWRRSGVRIVRRPRAHLTASMIVLIILASCAGLARFNYDDRKTLPGSVDSAVGYAAMGHHFPVNPTIPQTLLIQSPHDLRTPQALADLEQMAQRVSQLPGVATVRGITRPTGQSLEEASVAYQAGQVGETLSGASAKITGGNDRLDKLTRGSDALAANLGDVRGGVAQAIATVRGLVEALSAMQNKFGGTTTLRAFDDAAKLVTSMRTLGDALGVSFSNIAGSFDWAEPVLAALNASPMCDADPSCGNARTQVARLVTARHDGTFEPIAALARQLQSTQDTQTLGSTANSLRTTLRTATNAMRSLGLTDPAAARGRLAALQRGADNLADASRQVADGVQQLVNETKRMGAGLGDASAFLLAMKYEAGTPPMAGFYLPPQLLTEDAFKRAAQAFVSADGHAARYVITTDESPFGMAAMDEVDAITAVARDALPNTELADASISMAGYPVTLRDTRDYYDHDIRFIVVMTILVVFLILVALLRSIVAPLYLIGSVVVSYLAALGVGVILFQIVLDQELHWSVPGLAFIVLVALGADYNLLFMSRVREESSNSLRAAVIRTMGSTGGVITGAGLIFAASLFGLVFASISTVVQTGFVIGTGVLLDTFLVRTVTVPAIAVLLGRSNWWPSRRRVLRRSPSQVSET